MAHLTTLDELHQQITLLASVEESDAPFISVYLNLENGRPAGVKYSTTARAFCGAFSRVTTLPTLRKLWARSRLGWPPICYPRLKG